MCSSPRLIAAYHVLHRLSMPRHPPCALLRLISICWHYLLRFGFPKQQHYPAFSCQRAENQCAQWDGAVRATSRGLSRRRPRGSASTRRSRKEVIQPQVPLRLPCYDFAPVTELTFGGCPLAVGPPTSGLPSFHGVTGGVYKARERIHRGVADPRLLAIPASCGRVAAHNPNLDRLFAISAPLRVGDALYRPL